MNVRRARALAAVGRPWRAGSCLHDPSGEGTVFVACSTLCFARAPLDRALRMIGELEFSKVDVAIHEDGPHLRPSQVVADIALAAQRIRIGPSLSPAAFSVEIA